MIFNAKRETVWSCADNNDSFCPMCGDRLVAKHCRHVVSHWAHMPKEHGQLKCPHTESDWHLRIKLAYAQYEGWEIEVPVELSGRRFRIDAYNEEKQEVREFIHTLTPHYLEKQRCLRLAGINVRWILDGEEFHSKRACYTKDMVGIRRLLKPKSLSMAEYLEQSSDPQQPDVAVHLTRLVSEQDRGLYRHWYHNVWYPLPTTGSVKQLLDRYEEIDFEDLLKNPEKIQTRVRKEQVRQFIKLL